MGVVANLVIRIQATTRDFEKSIGGLSGTLQKVGAGATAAGAVLTAGLTVPLVALAAVTARAAMDFETSFAGVKKTVNATDAEFAQMAQSFRNLAKEIPVNVNELNRLGEAAGAMGIPKASIVEFARVMALLGVTTNLTSDQAAEGIGKIQNIFGAGGVDTDRFAATLVALGNDGASTESQILEMATRIAGAGNVIGMSQGQVLAYASALSSVGLEAEAGGSAISRVFIDIASAVSKGGTDLANFATVAGLPVQKFADLFKRDAAGATMLFIEGLGRIKTAGGNLLGTLEALGFTEIRQRDTLMRAAGAGDLLRRSLDLQNTAWRENTALSVESQKRFATTASQLTLLGNQLRDVGITIGIALLPFITQMVEWFKQLIPVIERVATWFAELPVPVQAVAIGFGLLAAAAGPVLFIVGQLITSFVTIMPLFAAGKVALGVLGITAGGTALALSGVALAIGAIWAAWQVGNIEGVKNTIATWTLMLGGMSKAEAEAAVQGHAAAVAEAARGSALDAALAPLQATLKPMASHAVGTHTAAKAAGVLTIETEKELTALIKLREEMERQTAFGASWGMFQGMNIDKAGGLTAVLERGVAKMAPLPFDVTPTLDQQRLFDQLRGAIPNIKETGAEVGLTWGQEIGVSLIQSVQNLPGRITDLLLGGTKNMLERLKAIGRDIAGGIIEGFINRLITARLTNALAGAVGLQGVGGVGVGGGGAGGAGLGNWGGALAGATTGLSVGVATGSKKWGALSGAATGASIGAFAGPAGAAIGAGVGALAGLIGGWWGGKNKAAAPALPSMPARQDQMARFRAASAASTLQGGGGGATTVNQRITIQGVLDRDSVREVFRAHIVPLTKQALMLNTDGLGEAHALAMDGR